MLYKRQLKKSKKASHRLEEKSCNTYSRKGTYIQNKEDLQLSNKKITQIRNGQKIWIVISQKEDIWMANEHVKNVRHH